MSPTQRALAYCKKCGYTAAIVEKWNHHAKIRQDCFGILDLIVLDGMGGGPLGVQVTSGSNHAARREKIRNDPRSAKWLTSPARLEVWSFSKTGERGKRKKWTLRIERLDAPYVSPPDVSGLIAKVPANEPKGAA